MLAALAALACAYAPDFSRAYASHATALRAQLLDGYDLVVPPASSRTANYSAAGTDVELEVAFFKIESVSAAEGRMRLKIWLRLYWKDERLAWDPALHGNLTTISFRAEAEAGGTEAEIWVPDVQPYNAMEGVARTLDIATARVGSDGGVFWSRPGMLDVMCRFSGLVAFPFDRLACGIEFGGWSLSGGWQGLSPRGDGFSFNVQETTSGSSYNEFLLERVDVTADVYEYSCCPIHAPYGNSPPDTCPIWQVPVLP